jgi:hypothetical protein
MVKLNFFCLIQGSLECFDIWNKMKDICPTCKVQFKYYEESNPSKSTWEKKLFIFKKPKHSVDDDEESNCKSISFAIIAD